MALATHSLNLKGSRGAFPSVPSLWSKGSKLKHFVPTFHAVGRKDRFISWKCRSRSGYFSGTCDSHYSVSISDLFSLYPKKTGLPIRGCLVRWNEMWNGGRNDVEIIRSFLPPFHSTSFHSIIPSKHPFSVLVVGASLPLKPKPKLYKRSAFKDDQFDDCNGGIVNGSEYLKSAVKVSYLKHKSEESSVESLYVQSDVPAPQAASVEATTRSLAIQDLLKSWLMLLHKPLQTQVASKIPEESSLAETSEMPNTIAKKNGIILKAVWCHISNLDTTIRIPFLVFTPLYLVVNLVYGMEVSKELTPLWVLGPLVVALYIKLFRALCGLYAFSFKQTVTVLNNLPVYYLWVHDHVSHGRLKEAVRIHISELVADIRNINTGRKLKDLQGWFIERHLDIIELVWPHYCRTIRFLKRMNFV